VRQGKEIDLPESCARQSWPSARAHARPLSRLLSQSCSLTTHLALRGLFDETKAAGEHIVRRLLLTHFGPRRFPRHNSVLLLPTHLPCPFHSLSHTRSSLPWHKK
jgi:hypothetical protein